MDNLHKAKYWSVYKDDIIKCELCPKFCLIKKNNCGFCGVRKNIDTKLYSLVYGHPVALHIDPMEKKPLFHFLPGSDVLSIGTVGCNLGCVFCQNWEIARAKPDEMQTPLITPAEIVKKAIKNNCKTIAYTYTEPTIAFEYVLDIAKLAHSKGIKNLLVTNGFINEKPFNELYPYIDAANVDLKSFTENFYHKMSMAKLQPILETLKRIANSKTWLEITTLLIPGKNDNVNEIKSMCKWIVDNLGKDVPLHFSRFFPMYKLTDIQPTKESALKKAYNIAKEQGLNYVYIGNIDLNKEDDTICPDCGKDLIIRSRFDVIENNIKNSYCDCGKKILGIWK